MKKYFLYELKKYAWALVILTAVCALPYMVDMATMEMLWTWHAETLPPTTKVHIQSPSLDTVFVELLLLLFIVPAIVYSFKMSKRGVDGYYSLPMKKVKLYFVQTMVGLILVLVPFTVAYWGGFFTLFFREGNPYHMGYYVPTYFGGVCFAIFLYGVNAFIFTRANRVADGVVFMLAYAFVLYLGLNFLEYKFDIAFSSWHINDAFLFSGGMFGFSGAMLDYVMGASRVSDIQYFGWWFGVTIAGGCISYALLFLFLPFERAENAEQSSTSPFGYCTLIPAYVAMSLGGGAAEEIFGFAIVLVAGVVATVVYKRKFSLRFLDWLPLLVGLVIGIPLMI